MKRLALLVAVACGAWCAAVVPAVVAEGAAGTTAGFSGRCSFSGPIEPTPPITAVPRPGAHFSYLGRGTCAGTLAGAGVTAAPVTVGFDDVHTLFDTCELGPDLLLHGSMSIGSGARRVRFGITVDMVRVAVAGPFTLRAVFGGLATGVAQFQPASTAAAVQQCAGAGVATATLSASFTTLRSLTGRRASLTGAAAESRARVRGGGG